MSRVLEPFEYFEPASLDEAAKLLGQGNSQLLAGGVDLLLKLRQRMASADRVVSLKKIPDLNYVEIDDNGVLHVGPMATMQQVAENEAVRNSWTALAEGNGIVGSLQTKRMSTVIGNLAVSTPVSDVAPALYVLGGKFVLTDGENERVVDAEDFFTGLGTTVLNQGELIKEITLEPVAENTASLVRKASKTHDDISKVCIGIAVTLADGVIADAKIALGAVAVTTVRAPEAEQFLIGKAPSEELFAEAGAIASQQVNPITDVRSTAEYRSHMVKIMVRDGLQTAVQSIS